jgi:hypothetical protein
VIAFTPSRSARAAISGALRVLSSQPSRIFRVTGRDVALTAASISRAASSGSRIRAEPDSAPVTSLAGHPMLKSMMSAPASAASLAPLATHSGVRPTNWITISGKPSPTAARRTTSGRPRAKLSQATISVAT